MICCPRPSPSIVNLVTLHSKVRFKHRRVGPNPSWGGGYCFPSVCYAWKAVVCLSRMVAAYGGWLGTRILVATLSGLSPRPPSPVSPQVSLVHSVPHVPGIYYLWLSPLVFNLVTSTQQSGFSTMESGQIPSWDQGYCFCSG